MILRSATVQLARAVRLLAKYWHCVVLGVHTESSVVVFRKKMVSTCLAAPNVSRFFFPFLRPLQQQTLIVSAHLSPESFGTLTTAKSQSLQKILRPLTASAQADQGFFFLPLSATSSLSHCLNNTSYLFTN